MQTIDMNSPRALCAPSAENLSAKWFVLLDDTRISLPRRKVPVSLVRHQGGIPADHVLVRDHNSPDDEVLRDDAEFDCAAGNVLYTEARCNARPPAPCRSPAKLAFSVDDRVEETIVGRQTRESLLALVGINGDHVVLLRDYESPHDRAIGSDDVIEFTDGPVFITRLKHVDSITIIVNLERKTVPGDTLAYEQVVRLAFDPPQPDTIYTVTYSNGPKAKPEGRMVAGDTVKIVCEEVFNVTDSGKS
jgi:hypothetical protein